MWVAAAAALVALGFYVAVFTGWLLGVVKFN